MVANTESPLDRLWKEYGTVFKAFDEMTLARWMCQTLGQVEGKVWRLSHPLIAVYRLAAQEAHDRQTWFKRLATAPQAYSESGCCRAPMLPLLTRDVRETGLICQHCGDTLVPFSEIPAGVRAPLEAWATRYGPVHAVAHWEDDRRKAAGDYDRAFDIAGEEAEELLVELGGELAIKILEFYPALVWEDQDECLEIRPEDIQF